MRSLSVREGDITLTEVDAIVTLINPQGLWVGGVDNAIQNVAEDRYHVQAYSVLKTNGLKDGQVVIAKGDRTDHFGGFDDVIFVVDALRVPLGDLVLKALRAAKEQGYGSIALPLMRTGVMLGIVEPNATAVVAEMSRAIQQFLEEGDVDMSISIIVYRDSEAIKLLGNSLKLLKG